MKIHMIEIEVQWDDLKEEAQKAIETSANIVGKTIPEDLKNGVNSLCWLNIDEGMEI